MKLGYNTWSMPTLTFEEAVPHLGRVGRVDDFARGCLRDDAQLGWRVAGEMPPVAVVATGGNALDGDFHGVLHGYAPHIMAMNHRP